MKRELIFFILSFFSLNVERNAMCRAALVEEGNSVQAGGDCLPDGSSLRASRGIGYAVYHEKNNKTD
jgi:hypothetical protein